ncbi:hypothetical protein H6P81_019886 [Aristolochia fimbriata]|uniref:Transposase MuDR plant domain-containing protein n=1 Tax=Aristolochia fimbriata TaxID=158543 RepID=A0AAV7DW60_ARIFI|nr:hypothetical protein H6P81_019886 [Aristolochia fimbriata]
MENKISLPNEVGGGEGAPIETGREFLLKSGREFLMKPGREILLRLTKDLPCILKEELDEPCPDMWIREMDTNARYMNTLISSINEGNVPPLIGVIVGQRFNTQDALQLYLKNYCIERHVKFKVLKSRPTLYSVRCTNDQCPWYVYTSFIKKSKEWKVRRCDDVHTCLDIESRMDNKLCTSRIICNIIMPTMRTKFTLSPYEIIQMVKDKYHILRSNIIGCGGQGTRHRLLYLVVGRSPITYYLNFLKQIKTQSHAWERLHIGRPTLLEEWALQDDPLGSRWNVRRTNATNPCGNPVLYITEFDHHRSYQLGYVRNVIDHLENGEGMDTSLLLPHMLEASRYCRWILHSLPLSEGTITKGDLSRSGETSHVVEPTRDRQRRQARRARCVPSSETILHVEDRAEPPILREPTVVHPLESKR